MNKLIHHIMALAPLKALFGVQDSVTITTDSSPIQLREFRNTIADKYKGRAFDYDVVEGEAENFLSRIFRWFFETIGELFGFQVSPEMFMLIKILFYVVLGVIVLFLLLKLILGESAASLFTRKDSVVAPIKLREEHIEAIDLEALLRDAVSDKNYRLAVRYLFLRSLQQLSTKQLIEWNSDKTNTDYYHELQNQTVKNSFKNVSYLYDNIWYGEYLLDATAFDKAKNAFDQLNSLTANAR